MMKLLSYPDDDNLCLTLLIFDNKNEKRITLKNISDKLSGTDALNRDLGCLIKNVII